MDSKILLPSWAVGSRWGDTIAASVGEQRETVEDV
jgi:hypothetical protein